MLCILALQRGLEKTPRSRKAKAGPDSDFTGSMQKFMALKEAASCQIEKKANAESGVRKRSACSAASGHIETSTTRDKECAEAGPLSVPIGHGTASRGSSKDGSVSAPQAQSTATAFVVKKLKAHKRDYLLRKAAKRKGGSSTAPLDAEAKMLAQQHRSAPAFGEQVSQPLKVCELGFCTGWVSHAGFGEHASRVHFDVACKVQLKRKHWAKGNVDDDEPAASAPSFMKTKTAALLRDVEERARNEAVEAYRARKREKLARDGVQFNAFAAPAQLSALLATDTGNR